MLFLSVFIFFSSCTDLNLNPLSEGSSSTWYSSESEITMALNDLYRLDFWPQDRVPYDDLEAWTDDITERDKTSAISNGTLTGDWGTSNTWWTNGYKCIARANTILINLENSKAQLSQETSDKFAAEARFIRASQYARLITYFGDVVYYTDILELEGSFNLSKTDKRTILDAIYVDYDFAASKLPTS